MDKHVETTKGPALVLRTCKADMTSLNGFVWPKRGYVEAPDWEPTKECGKGLHGVLWGEGNGDLLDWSKTAVWQVVRVGEWIDLRDKVKFPRGEVLHTGDRKSATDYILSNGAMGPVIGATVTAGDYDGANVGFKGTAIAGYNGTATAGDKGTAIAGNKGTAIAGLRGTATAGNKGTAIAGSRGTAIAGYNGTAIAGLRGTATAVTYGTATAGVFGTAKAGVGGTVKAGVGGTLCLLRFYRGHHSLVVAYVGENGIRQNTPYRLNEHGGFTEDLTQV